MFGTYKDCSHCMQHFKDMKYFIHNKLFSKSNIFHFFQKKFTIFLKEYATQRDVTLLLEGVTTTPPRYKEHGEVCFNGALVLARFFRCSPRELAEQWCGALQQWKEVARAEIANPGFINLHLTPYFWQKQLQLIFQEKTHYGHITQKDPKTINLEYVSVNPTGPMHIGHARGAIVGDVLANLMGAGGYKVTREFYMNDAGEQVDQLAMSVYARYQETFGIAITTYGSYPGDYLIPIGKKLADKHDKALLNQPKDMWLPIVRSFAVDEMMCLIRKDLNLLGIQHDVFRSERVLLNSGKLDTIIQNLQNKGHVYEGRLPPPKGQAAERRESIPRMLFKSTAFGDDIDRALTKDHGCWTYFASDIVYHADKLQRGYDFLINVWGADHAGYIKRIKSIVHALADKGKTLHIILCAMVKFLQDGKPITMSKRRGEFISVQDLIRAVGQDAVRFTMLTRCNDAPLDFDFEKAVAQSQDNPVFYVQYAYARACSVLRHGLEIFPEINLSSLTYKDFASLNKKEELNFIRLLCEWPHKLQHALHALEPHRLTYDLQNIAHGFHSLWKQGSDHYALRFVDPQNKQQTQARLGLVKAMQFILHSGFKIFGIKPLETL